MTTDNHHLRRLALLTLLTSLFGVVLIALTLTLLLTEEDDAPERDVVQLISPTFGPSPTALYNDSFYSYRLQTREQVGSIAQGIPVQIGSMSFNGQEWMYQIFTQNGEYAEARESQLEYLPNFTPDAPTPTMSFERLVGSGANWVMLKEPVGALPAGTRLRLLGSYFNGVEWRYNVQTDDQSNYLELSAAQIEYAPGYDAESVVPTAVFYNMISLNAYAVITRADLGAIPARTRVNIMSSTFDGEKWTYTIVAESQSVVIAAPEKMLELLPGYDPAAPTPTPIFDNYYSYSGYPFQLKEAVGALPAGTRVRIGSMIYEGGEWIYFVTTEDENTSFRVTQDQIELVADATPFTTPLPPKFQSWLGMGVYWVVTTADIGALPAGTRVRVSSATYNGQEWVYSIATEGDQFFGEARESQLDYAPDTTPGAPTPARTP